MTFCKRIEGSKMVSVTLYCIALDCITVNSPLTDVLVGSRACATTWTLDAGRWTMDDGR